ncbi:MAG: hypothetical protein NC131_20420 [Roseburia sp.]|nr:hypothetical protein [Roseburia sp.]
MSKGKDALQSIRTVIAKYTGSGDTVEAEQVIDDILDTVEGCTDKVSGLGKWLETFGSEEEKVSAIQSAISSMINGYANDLLPAYALAETGEEAEKVAENQRSVLGDKITSVQNASVPYMAALRYHSTQKPRSKAVDPNSKEYQMVLACCYVAWEMYAGYLVLNYPPKSFIKNVLGIAGFTREEFHGVVEDAMNRPEPFRYLCKQAAESMPNEAAKMKAAYESLFGNGEEDRESGVEVEPEPITTKATKGAKGLLSSAGEMFTSVFGDNEKHKEVLTNTSDKFSEGARSLGKKLGKKMIWIWRIIAVTDVVSFIVRLALIVISFFVDVTGPKTAAAEGFLAKIPLIGGLIKKAAKPVSATAIRTNLIRKSLPVLLALGVIAVMAVVVWRRKEKREVDNIQYMIISLIVIAATTASVWLLVKVIMAVVAAIGNEYFWATVYSKI